MNETSTTHSGFLHFIVRYLYFLRNFPYQQVGDMESLSQLLRRTIREGVPLYNDGQTQECYEVYLMAAQHSLESPLVVQSRAGISLKDACRQAEAKATSPYLNFSEAAWILRRCFDEILSSQASRQLNLASSSIASHADSSDNEVGYWQDERVLNSSDAEKGQALADIGLILHTRLKPAPQEQVETTVPYVVPGSEIVETLTYLGLAGNSALATEKCNLLVRSGLLVPVSSEDATRFQDGTHLYAFPGRNELEASLERIIATDRSAIDGTEESVLRIALETSLKGTNVDVELRPVREHGHRSSAFVIAEDLAGAKISDSLEALLPHLVIADRRYNLKKYEACFLGNQAVTAVLDTKLADSRNEALVILNDMLNVGLIHHVTHDHLVEDKVLFYRVTSIGDIKTALDNTCALPEEPKTGFERLRHSALLRRYNQFASLNIPDILNAFYGCDSESGWDEVDLQNWRTNMKRWGFGRREDQDDDMVHRLSPLLLSIDPETWDVTDDEEWESPFGIIAQIAIFDQVSRSAFRGTADAFKWDKIAIRATKVAIAKGYFETAYKSTLNQFLILLPLEHSESWEDQKLGVRLLLKLLSTVAIQDEGFSDYEIVKRLELSKRLSTAFLEHAQVVVKFRRYPHRNRVHGRSTTLEERIWLASDLVPRWAKSQNPEDAHNLIKLPIIPLKRLTKGR
jgi:uncharacterized protein (DUF924 family)